MTVEKPESISRVPEQEHISETEKTVRPVDEKVAAAATSIGAGKDAAIAPQHEMGAVESEGTPLKVQDIVSRVAKEPVKAHKFKEAILRCLENEGVHGGAEITDEVKRRVVEAILKEVVDPVFRPLHLIKKKVLFDFISLEQQCDIFNKCLECQKGESGENVVVAIAKLCAQQDGDGTARNIENFGITDQKGLIEIAQLCAQQDGGGTTWNIQNFDIKDQKALVEIAKLCAQQAGEGTAEYIQNFGITDEKGLIEIAMLCGAATAYYIKNFAITDEKALIEIAQLCAQRDRQVTARNIQNFAITDQKALIEIALLCAKQGGGGTAELIKNFGIKDQKALIEIAKLCAQQSGAATAYYIKNFAITDEKALIEIAQLCAKEDGQGTARNIQNFGITDQKVLIEIARLCAQQNGVTTPYYIRNFDITNKNALLEIASYCLLNIISNFAMNMSGKDFDLFHNFPPEVIEKIKTSYQKTEKTDFLKNKLSDMKWALDDSKETELNKRALVFLFFVCELLDKRNVFEDDTIKGSVQALVQFRVPRLKSFMLESLLYVIAKEKGKDFHDFIEKCSDKKNIKRTAWPQACLVLLTIFTANNLTDDLKGPVAREFLKNLRKRSSFLLAGPKTGSFVEFIRTLGGMKPENQKAIYDAFIDYKDKKIFSRKIFILQAAIAFDIDIFNKENKQIKTLEQIEEALRQHLGFPEGFEEIYETLRKPESLFIYVRRIQQLGDPDQGRVKALLKTYFEEVTNETYAKNRYSLSPQLKKMEEMCLLNKGSAERWKELIEKWKTPSKQGLDEFLETTASSATQKKITGNVFFLEKQNDGHFPSGQMPLLSAVLRNKDDTVSKELIQSIVNSEGKSPSVKRFDALCASLVLKGDLQYESVQEAFDCAPDDWEIKNDLLGLLTQLKSSRVEFSTYTIENTDHHWDLFLCGTEVAGSCQRVDGDPQLNKNLLGYVLDGKVRMIAVKDGQGQIVARSIIKLLWDGTANKPVLLLERVYANNTKLAPVVGQMAQKEALRLGVELISSETARCRRFQSYENRSGFEYEDSERLVEHVSSR